MLNHRLIAGAVAAFVALPAVAAADAPLAFFPAAPGSSLRLHVTRTVQAADGARKSFTEIVVRRTSATGGTVERTDGGRVSVAAVTFGTDGALHVDPNAARPDADTANVIDGLNFAALLVGGGTASGHDAWTVSLAPPPPPSNTIMSATPAPPTLLPIRVVKTDGINYDFDGQAQSSALPSTPQRTLGSNRSGGFGGGGGGGFGGYGRRPRRESSESPAPVAPGASSPVSPVSILTHVSGHASRGVVTHLTIEQSRSLSVEGLTYLNVSGWTFDVAR
jgi:hypothetical protein